MPQASEAPGKPEVGIEAHSGNLVVPREVTTVFVPKIPRNSVRSSVVRSYKAARHRTVSTLRRMAEVGGAHNFLILEADPSKNLYVQFVTSCGSAVVWGGAVSDRYLTSPLSWEQTVRLKAFGWRPPTRQKWPNYFRFWTVLNDADRRWIADIALETLERVYGWQPGTPLHVMTHLDW